MIDAETTGKKRGFASMNPEKQREIASKGGKAAHAAGRALEFTPDEARDAGRKGGQRVSVDRVHMAEIGRSGGRARARRLHSRTILITSEPTGESVEREETEAVGEPSKAA